MKEFILQNKKLITAVAVIAALLLINAIANNTAVYAAEPQYNTNYMTIQPMTAHGINFSLRETREVYARLIMEQQRCLRAYTPQTVSIYKYALARAWEMVLRETPDVTNMIISMTLIDAAISGLERIPEENIKDWLEPLIQEINEEQIYFNHWLLTTTALNAGLLIVVIFALAWGRA